MNASRDTTSAYQVVDRLLALRDLLRAEPRTWQQIHNRMSDHYSDDESAKRKLRRDLQYLERWGHRKVYDAVAKTYALAIRHIEYDWTDDELIALAALRESFIEGAPYANTVQALLKKMEQGLNDRDCRIFARKPALRIDLASAEPQSPAITVQRMLEDALVHHQRVRFQYRAPGRSHIINHADDEPLGMEFRDGHYYLTTYCYKTNKELEFRVDRIIADSLCILPSRAVGRWPKKTIHFQYRLSPKIAKGGASARFPDMDWEPQSDGSLIVTAQAYSEFHIIQEILRYGEHAEILSPDWLRAKMRQVVEKMMQSYGHVVR